MQMPLGEASFLSLDLPEKIPNKMANCSDTEDAPPSVGTRLSLCQLRPCQEPLRNCLVIIYCHLGSSGPFKDSNSKPFRNPVCDCSKENLQKGL